MVNYAADSPERALYEIFDDDRSRMTLGTRTLDIRDARTAPEPPTLDREGFVVVNAPSSLRDFTDPGVVEAHYLPELAETIKSAYGAAYVWMQPGHVIRVTDPAERAARQAPDAARFLHLDYSAASARRFLEEAVGYDPEVAMSHPRIFAVNTWRCLTPPPQDVPLAVCDKRTSSLEDLCVADAHHEVDGVDVDFEISLVRSNPAHEWWYFSDMRPDELLVFKGWDLGPSPTSCTVHGAFVDPTCSPDAPLRTSIEARGFAVFEG
ncbi:MAG: CmcJ/NvfI family oxidoreductase [Acidimicrobiales bacterium]